MNNSTAISIGNNSGMTYATLIPVTIGEIAGSVCQVVNAKDLHICLRVKDRFDQWIRRRAAEYGFREGEHFCTKLCKSTGGRRKTAFTLSMTMALNLAIVEKTEIGQRIRDYFIDCEKRLRQIAPEAAAEALRKALSPDQQHTLSGKVHSKVACLEKARQRAGYSELWSSLKAKHQVARYQDIAQGEFDEACHFVDSYTFEGQWIERPSQRQPMLSESDLRNMYALVIHAAKISEIYRRYDLYGAFKKLGSQAGVELHDHVGSAAFVAGVLRQRFGTEMLEANGRARLECDRSMPLQSCA